MKLLPLQIGDLTAPVPIIQGGMGIGVSRSSLASAVANAGGIGVISGIQLGFMEPDFETNTQEANQRALRKEIRTAREKSPQGILGVNLLCAMNHYKEMATICVEEKVDLIISGAGLPVDLPEIVKGSTTKAVPIVSSGKAAHVITKLWNRKYKKLPDAVIVEGPEAGGHLGFSEEDLQEDKKPLLEDLIREVQNALAPFIAESGTPIPVIAAGGIYTGEDMARYLQIGAAGVQMSTRFVGTEECDASLAYKMAYIDAQKEDIQLVKSPVGLPGRAVRNAFIEKTEQSRVDVHKCYNCLKTCNPKTTPYCISSALIEAVKGNLQDGLIFTGSNGYKVDTIIPVAKLMEELVLDAEKALKRGG